jgi:hypothetical protein
LLAYRRLISRPSGRRQEAEWRPTDEIVSDSVSERLADDGKAEEHLTTASTMYREMSMGFWLEQAEAARRPLT